MVKKLEDDLKKQGQDLNAALEFQGMTRAELENQLRIKGMVEKMLVEKIKVTDKEINEFIEKNKETFSKDMKEEELKRNIKEQLQKQKLSEKVQTWLNEIQKKAKIN